VVDLPAGGTGRTVADVRALTAAARRRGAGGRATRWLFRLRRTLGRVFHWDAPKAGVEGSYRERVPAEVRQNSSAVSADGSFDTLYELENESLVEVRNATVHAFLCVALIPYDGGYRLYWGVYVKPVSWLTPLYMAVIEPFRRFVVYPSLLGGVQRAWIQRYAASALT
jgi:hypothetical protein